VKETLANEDNYKLLLTDDATMKASYDVKHSVHVDITGTVLQRTNKVALFCERNRLRDAHRVEL